MGAINMPILIRCSPRHCADVARPSPSGRGPSAARIFPNARVRNPDILTALRTALSPSCYVSGMLRWSLLARAKFPLRGPRPKSQSRHVVEQYEGSSDGEKLVIADTNDTGFASLQSCRLIAGRLGGLRRLNVQV